MRYARKNPLSKAQQKRRVSSYAVRGYKEWLDPFPTVHGTRPEKMVYAALSARRIRFYFLNDIMTSVPELDIFKEYQADFILPDHKIIIEVQGAYWHSKPETVEADAFKFAMYQTMGYTVLAWWDYDIESNVNLLFTLEPRLIGYGVHSDTVNTELTPIKRTKVDTSQGIRTLNQRRAAKNRYKKTPIAYSKRKPVSGFYASGV